MRVTLKLLESQRKRQDRFVRRAEKRRCRAGMPRGRGLIRPHSSVPATADAAQGEKHLSSGQNHAILLESGSPLGECRVIPLLAEYFFEDWNKVAAVLGDMAAHESEIKGGFLNRSVLKPPPGLDSDADAAPRFRWLIRSEGDGFDYAKLLGA